MAIKNKIARGLASLVFAGSFLLPSALSAESQGQSQVKTLDAKIEYHEPRQFAVARAIKERGYGLCDWFGDRVCEQRSYGGIGILEDEKKIFTKHIGRIFPHYYAGRNLDVEWVVEVYGRENVPRLTELVTEIAKSCHVGVEVRLEREKAKDEWRKYIFELALFMGSSFVVAPLMFGGIGACKQARSR